MVIFRLCLSEKIGVQPAYVKGMEKRGLCYFTWPESYSVGGQCKFCNTILWIDPRESSILVESKPEGVPECGDGYRKYYKNKIDRFLKSLPSCPVCGRRAHDRFINNVSFPRFSDGTEFDDSGSVELINKDPASVEVWWVDGDPEMIE